MAVSQATFDSFEEPQNSVEERIAEAEYPWRDERVLRELYWNRELTTHQVAEKLSCSQRTICNWLPRHSIERRDTCGRDKSREIPWQNEETIRELYYERQLSAKEVGEVLGCSSSAVIKWLRHYGIRVRDRGETNRVERATYRIDDQGYEKWSVREPDGSQTNLRVHRLLAIADGADPHRVFDSKTETHHRAGDGIMNLAGGYVEVLTRSEHTKTHSENEWTERDGIPVLISQTEGSNE